MSAFILTINDTIKYSVCRGEMRLLIKSILRVSCAYKQFLHLSKIFLLCTSIANPLASLWLMLPLDIHVLVLLPVPHTLFAVYDISST